MSYVPILKGKEGEFGALEVLPSAAKDSLRPLIEIPDVPIDHSTGAPRKSVDDHLSRLIHRLTDCWLGRDAYIDLPFVKEGSLLEDRRPALEALLADCASKGTVLTPVVGLAKDPWYVLQAAAHARKHDTGLCLRLRSADFDEEHDTAEQVRALVERCKLDRDVVDLLLDLGELESRKTDLNRNLLVARGLLSQIPTPNDWRRLIVGATTFPPDLSEVAASTTEELPRGEWMLWEALQRRPERLPRRDVIYADYAISHPAPMDIDPRKMRMSASIRYTTDQDWLVVKGRNVRTYGFEQYFELCETLVGHEAYYGREFSWGDRYIAQCADRSLGPGNATTWRKVGTNHHITVVQDQLSRPRDVS